jgi:hypothetical protein
VEIEGTDAALRFDDIKEVFEAQIGFAPTSTIAKRIKSALDFLNKGYTLRTRTIVQSLITLTCKLVDTGRSKGLETQLRKFFETFMAEPAEQVEMGQLATDTDYVTFQRSVNANVKDGARTRQEIMLRKLFRIAPDLADVFDLFKATNKTAQALLKIRKPAKDLADYEALIDELYFLFRESVGTRLNGTWPTSFAHINDLRTDLPHDVDHGDAGKIRAKRRKTGGTFKLYAGGGTPDTIESVKFAMIQSNILGAIDADLRGLLFEKTK